MWEDLLQSYLKARRFFLTTVLKPVEIAAAVALGAAIGFAVVYLARKVKSEQDLQLVTLGLVLLAAGLALAWNLSNLLVCMALGSVVGNYSRRRELVFRSLQGIENPLYLIFFVLSGASLKLEILARVGLLGVGYVVFRVMGKMLGAYLGASITKAPEVVRKYLGLGLVPQAGVALGLSLLVREQFPQIGQSIATVIVAATVIYELVGPVVAKYAITRSGEVGAAE